MSEGLSPFHRNDCPKVILQRLLSILFIHRKGHIELPQLLPIKLVGGVLFDEQLDNLAASDIVTLLNQETVQHHP